jgi:putative ABC transport system permease protein
MSAITSTVPPSRLNLSLPWRVIRLALRELRSGLGGFYVFIACVALGVMVITTVGALSDALKTGFSRQGEAILGGDVTLARMHAPANPTERDWLQAQGRLSETATLRAIARRLDGQDQALIELKAVDAAYPMAGSVVLGGGLPLDSAIRQGDDAAADPILLERLGLKSGDRIKIGNAELTVRDTVQAEPDGIADRLTYGPRIFVSLATLEKTGLVQPGTLVRWRYSLKLPDGAGNDSAALAQFRVAAKKALPESGFSIADRRDPSPQISKTLERLRQFLTLLGLTSLLVGGVGVANAVNTFIDKRRKVIATMRSLGATSRLVFFVFLAQVMAMAAIGVAIGVALGILAPAILTSLYGDVLPIKAEFSVSAATVATAAVYGFLVALLFTLWPLGRAEAMSAAVLFRDELGAESVRPRAAVLFATAVVAAILVLCAVLTSDSQRIALYFCIGITIMFAVFMALGRAVTWAASRVRRPRRPELSLAIGNVAAPGGLTKSIVLSLGTGLSLLTAVTLADASLVNELTSRMPANSPDYFVLDIPKADYAAVSALITKELPNSHLVEAPMLRGRLVRLKDKPVEEIKAPPEAQWVLNGDRGLTYADTVPEGSKVVAGEWWPKDYSGEPLVSFEAELAEKLDLKIGDQVTVNVLGRNLTARISNLRDVKWESLALNFVMVFSPNTMAQAPHAMLATVTLPKGTPLETEVRMARVLGQTFPAVTPIRVRDAIEAFNGVFAKIMTAVRVAGGVTLLSGALVLAGALATAQRKRILEAVILKTLGATRRRIMTAHLAEYLMLAAVTALFAVVLGGLAAWVAVAHVMEIEFSFSWTAVAQTLALATALVAIFGGMGTWTVLRARPVPYLRTE